MKLKESYSTTRPVAEIAAELGVSERGCYQKARALGLKKPEDCHSFAGKIGSEDPRSIATRFKAGHVPANKGKRMTSELYAKCASTMFKKGHRPQTYLPIGSEVVVADGYIKIKIADPNVWRWKHRLVWEAANGPIPKGYNIQFKDGNRQNTTLDNLYLISRAEQLLKQNSLIARYPKELADVIRLKGAVKRQMTLYNKRKNNKDE